MKKIVCLSLIVFISSFLFAQDLINAEDYTLNFFRKFNKTQTKLTYMNKKSSLAKIGTETVNGDISGTVFYDVKFN